jgi:hypothetical protein
MLTEYQTIHYEEQFSTTVFEESGIKDDHEWGGLNSVFNLGTGLMGLNLVRQKRNLQSFNVIHLALR